MAADTDDALSWEGDDVAPALKPTLPQGWNAVGKGSDAVGKQADADMVGTDAVDTSADTSRPADAAPMSTAMLLVLGVVGGVYLLYTVGWVIGGLRLKPLANLIVADAMYLPWFILAAAAPALWFLAAWVLTRGKAAWVRVSVLLLGVVLLVPWPFVTVGVIGS